MNTSYIFLADGFEEIEALTVVDVMRRAGMDIKTVSITDKHEVKGAHGVTVTADTLYDSTDFIMPEWLILPGGMPGSQNLADFQPLATLLKAQAEGGKKLTINIGFSHPVVLEAPENVTFETPEQTKIVVKGINKQVVGNLAADIRAIRKPEPYLGKGIKYEDEVIRRKEGKTGK